MKTLLALLALSIMGFHTAKDGSLRLTLWDGENYRSAIIVKNTQPYAFFRTHVSRDSVGTFGETDAETVQVTFVGDTISEVK